MSRVYLSGEVPDQPDDKPARGKHALPGAHRVPADADFDQDTIHRAGMREAMRAQERELLRLERESETVRRELERRVRQLTALQHAALQNAALLPAPEAAVPVTRPANRQLARDHELARMRAKLINGATAASELAERLSLAHVQAGKPALGTLVKEMGCYTKSTLSKVFNNKMPPTWRLVRKLGEQLHVPQAVVMQEWLPLWMAADAYRQETKTVTARGTASVTTGYAVDAGASAGSPDTHAALAGQTGYTCPKCGAWVLDTALHTGWHMQREPQGKTAPAAESMGIGWNGESAEINLLREALGTDEH